MREVAIRDVELASIRTSPGFAQRTQDPQVLQLAQSIRIAGLISPPCVRLSDMRLVVGEDRVAACFVLGEKTVRCKMVECTDREVEITRRVENAYRRHDFAEQAASLTELLDLVEQEVKEERAANPPPKGTKTTARGEARRRVGAAIGKSEAALAKHDSRQRDHLTARPKAPKEEVEWQLDGYGFEVPAAVQARAAAVREAMEAADNLARQIQRTLTSVSDVFPQGNTVHELARRGAAVARALVPSHLCPWCKGNEHAQPFCGGCGGHGFVGERDFESADEQLRTERLISYQGSYVNMDTLRRWEDPTPMPEARFISEDSFELEEEPPAGAFMDESEPMYGEEEF